MNPISFLELAYRTALSDYAREKQSSEDFGPKSAVSSIFPSLRRSVFLIGAPRSGTSFLGSCLRAAERISYHHEPILTKHAAQWVYKKTIPRWALRLLYRATYRWLMRIHLHGKRRFAEKTPRNCFLIPFLDQLCEQATFIHIIRDGRDVALSYSEKPWLSSRSIGSDDQEPGGYSYGPVPRFWVESHRRDEFRKTSDIHRCIWAWRRFVTTARLQAEQLPEERYLEVRYEHLVENTNTVADRILQFLDMRGNRSAQQFRERIRQVHSDSKGRWQDELDEGQLEEIEEEAGPLLRELGYA